MSQLDDEYRPTVFLSYAWDDQSDADRLAADLERHGLDPFVDRRDIPPGENVVSAINTALSQSDYFVLLWSKTTADRPWVTREWCAALARGIRERRAFLFVIRLDQTDVPVLLSTDRFVDAFAGWDAAIKAVVEAWRQDRAMRVPVLPPPEEPAAGGARDGHVTVLHVYNQALEVAHLLVVPTSFTVRELEDTMRSQLALPDSVTGFNDLVGMRFSYQLNLDGKPLPENGTLAALGVADYTTMNLEVWQQSYGPDGPTSGPVVFRTGEPTELPATMVRKLTKDAFGHLMPWPPSCGL